MVALAAAIGAWLMLVVFAVAHAEAAQGPALYAQSEMTRLLAAVVAAVALPIVVLIGTASRLSASLRDRRLATLRLLGLRPSRTRVVAAVEVGSVAVVGTLVGVAFFWLTRDAVAGVQIAGRDWAPASFAPTPLATVAVLLAVPAAAMVFAVIPTRSSSAGVWASARRADARRPRLWRVLPVTLGVVLLLSVLLDTDRTFSDPQFVAFFAGTALAGLGLLVLIPVFVRLLADVLVRVDGPAALRIAGRRLQLQPAAANRVVAGLLLGLFLVAGARCVVTAFETTPQYVAADQALNDGPQAVQVGAPRPALAEVRQAVESVPGVRGVGSFIEMRGPCGVRARVCIDGIVGTCDDLQAVLGVSGCRDDQAFWLDLSTTSMPLKHPEAVTLRYPEAPRRDAFTIPAPTQTLHADTDLVSSPVYANVFVPAALPGLPAQPTRTSPQLTVLADGGSSVVEGIEAAAQAVAARAYAGVPTAREDYYFVAGLRATVWSVAAVVLAVGLLAFSVGAIDRAVARRSELAGLLLLGTPARTLRGAQWLESLAPLVFGVPLAAGLGLLAGSAFLAFGGELQASPWQQVGLLTTAGLAAAVLVAGLTVVASAPRIRGELIRQE